LKKSLKFLALLLCLVMSLALAGCNNKPTTEGTATPAPTTSATATATQKTIYMKAGDIYRYLVWNFATDTQYLEGEGIRGDNIRAKYDEMESTYGIDIQFVVPGADWINGTLESAYSGSPVTDIFHMGGPFTLPGSYMYQDIPGSALLPFSDYTNAATFSDAEYWNVNAQANSGMYGGKLYFVIPNDYGWGLCALNQATFFNKDLVQSAGINPADMYTWSTSGEWTWEKVEQVAIAATDASTSTYGLLAGENNCIMFSLMAGNNADYIAKKDVNGQQIDRYVGMDPNAIEAWDFFVKLSVQDKAVLQYSGTHETVDFATGKVAMMFTYINRAETIRANITDFEYGLIMPPKGPKATDYVSDMNWFGPLAMMQNIANPEGTAQFCEMFFAPPYAASSEENIELLKTEVAQYLCDEQSVQTCVDIISKTSPKSYMTYAGTDAYSYMWSNEAVAKFISGETTPAAYFASVESAVNAAIDECLGITTG